MSENSNPSNNSPASTHHRSPSTTAVGEDTTFTTQLLMEFNNRQNRHISVLSTSFSIQYVPHSPTPSVQEVTSPPPLHIHITPDPMGHCPPISPRLAKTILHIDESSNLQDTTHAIAYGLISTVHQQTATTDQNLAEAHCHINQLTGAVHSHKAKIHCLQNRVGN